MKIQAVMDEVENHLVGIKLEKTVDTLKSGDAGDEVRGIAITFTASMNVLREAAKRNLNFIITHEPTYYHHYDDPAAAEVENDPVYHAKRKFIERHRLTIWRYHDALHRHKPDLINEGMLRRLQWENLRDPEDPRLVRLPEQSVRELAQHLKRRLAVPMLRVVGDADMRATRAAMLLGAVGGERQLAFIREHPEAEVVICGETVEWMTCEYVRDAVLNGRRLCLLILGHYHSEDAGMAYFAELLRQRYPELPVVHLPSEDAVIFL